MGVGLNRTAGVALAVAALLGMGGGYGLVSAVRSEPPRPVVLPVTPCRVADTRPATQVGPRNTPLGPGDTHTIAGTGVTGECDVPVDALGLLLNVTAVDATEQTNLRVFPADADVPLASNLNPSPGSAPIPNSVLTDLSNDGRFSIFNQNGLVDLVIDVNGYLVDHDFDDRYYTKADVDALLASQPAGPTGPQGPVGPTGPPGADGDELFEQVIVVTGERSAELNGQALSDAVDATTTTPSAPKAIFVEPGLYDVGTTELVLGDSVSLVGSGRSSTVFGAPPDGAVLRVSRGALVQGLSIVNANTTVERTSAVEVDRANDVVLADLVIRGVANDETDGVEVTESPDIFFDNVDIAAASEGVRLLAGSDAIINNSRVVAEFGAAIALRNAGTDVRIEYSEVDSDNAPAIDLQPNGDSRTVTVRHSTVVSENQVIRESDLNDENNTVAFHQVYTDAPNVPTLPFADATCFTISSVRAGQTSDDCADL